MLSNCEKKFLPALLKPVTNFIYARKMFSDSSIKKILKLPIFQRGHCLLHF